MKIIKLFRPATLVAPMVGASMFSILALKDTGRLLDYYEYVYVFLGAFILAMTNAAGNIFNHIIDAQDTDKYNAIKKNRPIASGEIDPFYANAIAVYIFGFGIVMTFVFFNILSGILISIIMFFAFSYSMFPRFKKMFVVGNMAIATPRGMLGVLTAYSFFSFPTIPVLTFSFILGVFVFLANTTKDISDYDADKKAGIRNFVTVMGVERAIKYIIIPGMYMPFVLYAIAYVLGMVNNMYVFLALPLSVYTHYYFSRNRQAIGENDRSWYLFYAQLSLLSILFVIPMVI
mgnify:CR=1 FL=1